MADHNEIIERQAERGLHELLSSIYQPLLKPDDWSATLDDLRSNFDANVALIVVHEFDTATSHVQQSTPLTPELNEYYQKHFVGINAWLDFRSSNCVAGKVFSAEQTSFDYDPVAGTRSPPKERRDLPYSMIGIILRDSGRVMYLLVDREQSSGPFGPSELKLCGTILPHLRQSWLAHQKASHNDMILNSALDALDGLRIGVTLVDETQRVVACNREAAAIFAANNGMSLHNGKLQLSSSAEEGRLKSLISMALEPSLRQSDKRRGTLIVQRNSEGQPFRIVVPYSIPDPNDGKTSRDHRKLATLLIADPEHEISIDPEDLSTLYGLTVAEARVAGLLVEGMTLREVASQLEVSYNTVRTHLNRVLDKSGADRQSQFVRLVLAGPAGIAAAASNAPSPSDPDRIPTRN